MIALEEWTLAAGTGLLVIGFAYAAVSDWRDREVTDRLWQGLGLLGALLGVLTVLPGGTFPVLAWLVIAALTLEHMFSWDDALGESGSRYADIFELAAYLAVGAFVTYALLRVGLGPSGFPVIALAVFVTVVFARVLFELGVLYGGADAKALMIAGMLVPLFPQPVLLPGPSVLSVPTFVPFPIDLLMNAALLSIAIPIGVALRNAARGQFTFPKGFTGYSLPVGELPRRYVWVRDPAAPGARDEEAEIETSEEDRRHRRALAEELRARGIRRVWVTPQIPFLVLMALGAVTALLLGNLVVDLLVLI